VRLSLSPPVSPRRLALADGASIAAFTVIGILSHEGHLAVAGLAQDALPLLAGWFAAAAALRLYERRTKRALLLTWAIGIPAGVLMRATALGRLDEPRQLAFLATTLVLTLAFVSASRAALSFAAPQGPTP
jgi:hypothetical protein